MNDFIPKKFKFDLDDDTRQQCIRDIEKYFIDNDWPKDIPQYQTYPVLFERQEPHWRKIEEIFFKSFLMYSGECPTDMKSWAYVSFIGKSGSKGERWHDHFTASSCNLSAVMYLQCEDRRNGTMFLYEDNIVIPLVYNDTIYVFDSQVMHSPTTWDHVNGTQNRIVISADCYF